MACGFEAATERKRRRISVANVERSALAFDLMLFLWLPP